MSNKTVLGSFLVGLVIEVMLVLSILKDEKLEVIFEFNGMGD